MFKSATVTEVRDDFKRYLDDLPAGPVVVTSRGRNAAVIVELAAFENLLETAELLEDLVLGHQALAEYLADPTIAVDAEEVFQRLGV